MTPLLDVCPRRIRLWERKPLRDLDARIFSSDCIALVGPNGVGKTTLLRLAAGISRPGFRRCTSEAQERWYRLKQREIAKSIAFVPQNVEMPFPFTVEQFVEQGRTPFLRCSAD